MWSLDFSGNIAKLKMRGYETRGEYEIVSLFCTNIKLFHNYNNAIIMIETYSITFWFTSLTLTRRELRHWKIYVSQFSIKITSLAKYFAGGERNDEVENGLKFRVSEQFPNFVRTLFKITNYCTVYTCVKNYSPKTFIFKSFLLSEYTEYYNNAMYNKTIIECNIL